MTTQNSQIQIPSLDQIATASIGNWITLGVHGEWIAKTSLCENDAGTRFGLDDTVIYAADDVESTFPIFRTKTKATIKRRFPNAKESSPRYTKESAKSRAAAACQTAMQKWYEYLKGEAEAVVWNDEGFACDTDTAHILLDPTAINGTGTASYKAKGQTLQVTEEIDATFDASEGVMLATKVTYFTPNTTESKLLGQLDISIKVRPAGVPDYRAAQLQISVPCLGIDEPKIKVSYHGGMGQGYYDAKGELATALSAQVIASAVFAETVKRMAADDAGDELKRLVQNLIDRVEAQD